MDDERDTNQSNENAEENDAREEDVVSDTDADTRDIENTEHDNAAETEARFQRLEGTLERILGEISSIREAQGIMVENGAVINDTGDDMDFTDADAFVPPSEMDLLL